MNNPHSPPAKKERKKRYTFEERGGGGSVYWISQRRNRLVVPRTANARHREVVAEGGRTSPFIIFVSPSRKGRWGTGAFI